MPEIARLETRCGWFGSPADFNAKVMQRLTKYPLLLAAEAECDAMERLLRVDQTHCSGLQSELRFLQATELM